MTNHNYVGTELEIFKSAVNWKSYWSDQIRPHICGQVLEVGAGIGSSTFALQKAERSKWTCLEPDQNLAARLAQYAQSEKLEGDYEVIAGTLAELPDDARYDTILYLDVLEHIEDDCSELNCAVKRLEKGGNLIILAPAHQFLFSNFDRAIGHYRRYSRNTLLSAAPAELTLVQANYLDSVGLLASLSNRLLLQAEAPSQSQITFWDNVMIPCSRILDPLLLRKLGKSILAIWRNNSSDDRSI